MTITEIKTPHYIDLNADLGEHHEAAEQDAALLQLVTSANIACGGHAGGEHTMRRTLQWAQHFGVAAGAHPSFPDRANFGRLEIKMDAAELEDSLTEQISELLALAREVGVPVVHVKPHGALYHVANKDADVARIIAEVVRKLDPKLILVGQAGSQVLAVYREMGLSTAAEAFADRAYEADGTLRNRKLPGALLENPADAARQARSIALDHRVVAYDGTPLEVSADTLCLHSDTPDSPALAKEVRRVLEQVGVGVRRLG